MSWRVFAAFALLYVFTAKGYLESIDTQPSVMTAESIVTSGRIDIPYTEQSGSILTSPGTRGRFYSRFGIGVALAFVPPVALAHVAARLTHQKEVELAGFFVSFVNVGSVLVLLFAFSRVLRSFGTPPPTIVLLTMGLGFGSLCWRYAVYDFTEELQAALLLVTFERVLRGTRRGNVVGSLALAFLILMKVAHIVFAPVFGLYVLFRTAAPLSRRIREGAIFAAPVVAVVALHLVLNQERFGSPFETGYGAAAHKFAASNLISSIPSLLVSLDKGLFVFCPVLVLGVLGFPSFLRRRRLDALLTLGLALVALLFVGTIGYWGGGWAWGPRYLVPTIAFWLLPAAFWLDEGRVSQRFTIAAALTMASIIAQVPGVLVKDQEIHHIQEDLLTDAERPYMTPDYEAAWIFLAHKLEGKSEIYSVRDFGVPGDRTLDMSAVHTFEGFNVWTEQLAHRRGSRAVHWFGVLGILAALALMTRVAVSLWGGFRKEAGGEAGIPAS